MGQPVYLICIDLRKSSKFWEKYLLSKLKPLLLFVCFCFTMTYKEKMYNFIKQRNCNGYVQESCCISVMYCVKFVNIYMNCTLWTPFQAERERDFFNSTLIYILFSLRITWHSFLSVSRDRNIRYNFHGSRSRARVVMNLCKKVPGTKVSGKKPGNINFGKYVTGNKVLCFGFLGLFS